MNSPRLWSSVFLGSLLLFFAGHTQAESPNTKREIEKARKETFPRSAKLIEDNTDAKVALDVDVASFGDDEKAWGNLYIVANRIVGALAEVGKDQVGKDAIAKSVRNVRIVKSPASAEEDGIELKDGTLTVNTAATDQAMVSLQGIISRSLEKALGIAPVPEKAP